MFFDTHTSSSGRKKKKKEEKRKRRQGRNEAGPVVRILQKEVEVAADEDCAMGADGIFFFSCLLPHCAQQKSDRVREGSLARRKKDKRSWRTGRESECHAAEEEEEEDEKKRRRVESLARDRVCISCSDARATSRGSSLPRRKEEWLRGRETRRERNKWWRMLVSISTVGNPDRHERRNESMIHARLTETTKKKNEAGAVCIELPRISIFASLSEEVEKGKVVSCVCSLSVLYGVHTHKFHSDQAGTHPKLAERKERGVLFCSETEWRRRTDCSGRLPREKRTTTSSSRSPLHVSP